MILLVLQMIASGIGALGGGVLADFFGQRLPLGFSLTLYGISTALEAFTQCAARAFREYTLVG